MSTKAANLSVFLCLRALKHNKPYHLCLQTGHLLSERHVRGLQKLQHGADEEDADGIYIYTDIYIYIYIYSLFKMMILGAQIKQTYSVFHRKSFNHLMTP